MKNGYALPIWTIALAILFGLGSTAVAAQSSSTNYAAPPGLFANGGGQSSSANYQNFSMLGYSFAQVNGNSASYQSGPAIGALVPGATVAATTSSTLAGTTTTTTVAATTTTTQATTIISLNLAQGWNLLGNSSSGALDVAAAFGDASKVTTVWKWIASGAKWAFYAPSLIGQALTDYATNKGYDVLSTINGGEGFWVNAKTAFTSPLPSGTPMSSASFQGMASGWNLIAIGDNKTPREFNSALSSTQPAAGDIPLNLTTLWVWDATLANWYFYAPSLDKNGGLVNYITNKSYLDFGTKVLDPTTGFWVNKP